MYRTLGQFCPVFASFLSVVSVFVAVYFYLFYTVKLPPLSASLFAILGAVITAVAEIGLFLISNRKRRKEKEKENKKWLKHYNISVKNKNKEETKKEEGDKKTK
jgi:nicotinamide riboside transporter PnuC